MNDYFGITGGLQGPNTVELLRELNVGWIRFPLNRGEVERRGFWNFWRRWNWRKLDQTLAIKRKHLPRIKVLLTVRNHPFKATDLRGYRRFMRKLLARVGGTINAIQIENEVDSSSWWDGTPEEYDVLLGVGVDTTHQYAFGVMVLAAGLTSQTVRQAVRIPGGTVVETAVRSAARRADAVDLHCYHEPENIPAYVEWMRGLTDKPIWITETGGPDDRVAKFSEEAQADEVRERVRLARACDIEHFFWLHLFRTSEPIRWSQMALCREGGSPTPAFYAYRDAIAEVVS